MARRRHPAPHIPPPGSVPGTLAALEPGPEPCVRLIAYAKGEVEERVIENVEEIGQLVRDDSHVEWIDVESFGDGRTMKRIGEILGLHPLAMADIVNTPQRPKSDRYDDRVLLVTQMARIDERGEIDVEQVSIVFGPGWVVTFQERPGDVFEPVRTRIRNNARICGMGADYLAYALLDAVIDGYFPVVEKLGSDIEELEEEVAGRPTRQTLMRVHAIRRRLIELHRVQWRQRDAIGALLREGEFPFSDPVRVYLRDAYDHAFQTLDAIETQREMVVSLMELYLSSASNRMNDTMKTLTLIATIFIPLTFLVGVYGMNFDYMPELRWRWGYPAIWALMIVLGVGLYIWFRRRGFLESDREN